MDKEEAEKQTQRHGGVIPCEMWPQAEETGGTRLRMWEAGEAGREQASGILQIKLRRFHSRRVSERLMPIKATCIDCFKSSKRAGWVRHLKK